MNYDLAHLIQDQEQKVFGPIQDDEALFLYGFIKTTLARNIVELGYLSGYSAKNFLAAVGSKGKVLSIDVAPVSSLANNHFPLVKNIEDVLPEEIPFEKIDLLFCDTHQFESTIVFYKNMIAANKITAQTTIVLHDTGLHHVQFSSSHVQRENGWAHQLAERRVSDFLIKEGWHAIHAHGKIENFADEIVACRHGLTLLQKKRLLEE